MGGSYKLRHRTKDKEEELKMEEREDVQNQNMYKKILYLHLRGVGDGITRQAL